MTSELERLNAIADEITRKVGELTGRNSPLKDGPALYYGGANRGWTAVGECKPSGRPYRIVRSHGTTALAALRNLSRELDQFARGARDGEQ